MSDYFSEIGVWPRNEKHMGTTYAYGFALSLLLTLGAYALAAHHMLSPVVLIPVLLIFACLQFMVQVLNFLHVNGEPVSRERLVMLGCAGVIMLILVVGSMWIMSNLDARMMVETDQMEMYMQDQQGI